MYLTNWLTIASVSIDPFSTSIQRWYVICSAIRTRVLIKSSKLYYNYQRNRSLFDTSLYILPSTDHSSIRVSLIKIRFQAEKCHFCSLQYEILGLTSQFYDRSPPQNFLPLNRKHIVLLFTAAAINAINVFSL